MAQTVTCARCGGAVPMAALSAAVTCPYCRAQIQLSPGDLATLGQYHAHVRAQLARADQERLHAEGWNRLYGGGDVRKKSNPLIGVFILLALVIPLALLGFAVNALGLAGSMIANLMPVAVFGLFAVVFGGYLVWFHGGPKRTERPNLPRAAPVRCPQCGAPHELGPGEVLDRCRFCSAPLLPDQRVMDHGRAEADRVVLGAELERSRAERRGMTALSSSSVTNAVPYIVLGSFLPMTALAAIGFTVSFLLGKERDSDLPGIALLWALAFVNVGLMALVYVYRRNRRQRLEVLAESLVAHFGGALLPDQWAMNGWMDRHWAGTVPVQQMFRGAYFSVAACPVEGYPVLLVMNPVGASEDYPGFVSVRVGAWLSEPEHLSSHPAVVAARHALQALGFSLELMRAGLIGLSLEKSARRVIQAGDPRALGDAMLMLARTARDLGGMPVDIPGE